MADTATTGSVSEFLKTLGVNPDFITKIETDLGATSVEELAHLTEADLISAGMKPLPARALVAKLTPAPKPAEVIDPKAELAEGEEPSKERITSFAGSMGVDPMTMMMFMNGMGGDMDLSGMMPIRSMVDAYNPKRRDMFLMVMGQVENRLGVPIIVIDGNGTINRGLTVEYIEGLEEGREPAENNIYFGEDSTPHEVIRVGVDAQSIYDADPLDPTKALQKNDMGIGRVSWRDVSLEVRQVAYLAANKTREVDPKNDGHLSWLRDHMKKGCTRLEFHGQAPRAIAEYNEAARTGSLPTLRVMLSRSPRRQEIFPRRRTATPQDLSGIGDAPRDGRNNGSRG